MDIFFLDAVVQAFVAALTTGFQVLSRYSLGILAFCALVTYCSSLWPVLLSGGDGLSAVLLIVVRIGLFYFITVSLGALSMAALNTFLQWGAEASGGRLPAPSFSSPRVLSRPG